MECEKVPESFPGTVAIKEDIARNTLLHKDYRRYKNGPDADFEYFVTRLLAKMNPLRTNFRMKKKEHLISDIFTTSDEAFVLFVLYNELECWEAQREDMKKGMSGRKLVKVKRFCNGTSGKREAWSEKGMLIYRRILFEVDNRRKESVDFERELRKKLTEGDTDNERFNAEIHEEGDDEMDIWKIPEEDEHRMQKLMEPDFWSDCKRIENV